MASRSPVHAGPGVSSPPPLSTWLLASDFLCSRAGALGKADPVAET